MKDPERELDERDREALLRWRLALGPLAESESPRFGLDGLSGGGGGGARGGGDAREELGALDDALTFVYGGKKGSLARSRPYIPEWLSALRAFFRKEVIALVERDAVERKGLVELLFEPETLPLLEKNVDLVATLVSARGLIPDKARETARQIVREVVAEVRKKLETEIRSSILGARRRDRHGPLKIARNIDWKRTIRSNLKGWDRERKRLVPERFYFWSNQTRRNEWDMVILVDQSGSMAHSVVYSSIMAAIFASIDVLRTRLCFFDTEVVDVSHLLVDPVDVLFTSQLGGGTDINRAVAYVEKELIERPEKTIFLLISDLYEGGDARSLLARLRRLVDSHVKVICLLALSDEGVPDFDHEIAQKVRALGIACFGCSPRELAPLIGRVMQGQDLMRLETSFNEEP